MVFAYFIGKTYIGMLYAAKTKTEAYHKTSAFLREFFVDYPNKTSQTSIRQKPKRREYVAPRSSPCACVSGIISSLITYSIVPPANAKANGKIAVERLTAK